ncbi:MAG: hypothetical protein Q7R49_03270 [Candidatus Daviesbacteria bacterium]|nr:hypothetical protein [Candidatus Daviesbacteria bacterium]
MAVENFIDQELRSINNIVKSFGTQLLEEDIPLEFSLIISSGALVYERQIPVSRDGHMGREKWFFAMPNSIADISTKLTEPTKDKITNLAVKLGIEEDTIIKAAMLTKTLTESLSDSPISVNLCDGPEALRLGKAPLPATGLLEVAGKGSKLEYFTSDEYDNFDALRILLLHTNQGKADFKEVFPRVLLLSIHVAEKRQRQSIQVNDQIGTTVEPKN